MGGSSGAVSDNTFTYFHNWVWLSVFNLKYVTCLFLSLSPLFPLSFSLSLSLSPLSLSPPPLSLSPLSLSLSSPFSFSSLFLSLSLPSLSPSNTHLQLYSLFLTAAAALLKDRSDPAAWANAMHAGTDAMRWYGGADPGDRTMLDALCPAVEELRRLTTSPPGGHMAILQAAVEVLYYTSYLSLQFHHVDVMAVLRPSSSPLPR
uniref:DhaL domain-containing protein n=1 Tax=Hucho hucho TaxID=62062 RepID=A0A4W5MMF2_9TELE